MKRRILFFIMVATILSGSVIANAEDDSIDKTETEVEEAIDGMVWDAKADITTEEQAEISGITIAAPEGAENIMYNVLLASQDYPIAETVFEYDGKEYFLRAQLTDLLELKENDERADISGWYYEWDTKESAEVKNRPAYVYCNEEAGLVTWLDVAPGVLYNLGTIGETNADELLKQASLFFVPLQDDVDGDEEYSSVIIGGADGPTSIFLAGKLEPSDDGLKLKIPQNEEEGIATLPLDMIMVPVCYTNGELSVAIYNQTGTEAGYGNEYKLQRKIREEWQDMEPVQEFCWTEEYHLLQDTEIAVEVYDLSYYGELEPGNYKLVKTDLEAEFILEITE